MGRNSYRCSPQVASGLQSVCEGHPRHRWTNLKYISVISSMSKAYLCHFNHVRSILNISLHFNHVSIILDISLPFQPCQKHISAISTMSKAYRVQWRVRVSCFKTLCPGMEGLVWHSATTQSACGEISSLKLHPPRFLVAGTVFSTLMVTIVFVQLAIKYSHITSPKSTTKSQTMLARGATII